MKLNLYLDSNKITDVSPLKWLSKIWTLSLSNNTIKDLSPLKELDGTRKLFVMINGISNLLFISKFNRLREFRIAFNNITLFPNDFSESLQSVFIDKSQISLFDKMVNHRIVKKKAKQSRFLWALFLVVEEDLEFHYCNKTLEFMKRNVLLNLFYYNQIDSFFVKCRHMDL